MNPLLFILVSMFIVVIEKHGMGNWRTISELMETKSPKQVEEHYWDHYMGVHGYCLPAQFFSSKGPKDTESLFPSSVEDLPVCRSEDLTLQSVLPKLAETDAYYKEALKDDLYRIGVNITHQRGELARSKESTGKVGKLSEAAVRERLATLPGADLPGFMPLREDFDVEYENDAEEVLANMEFNPDDHPSETELKLSVLRIYNRKLEERNRRKRFVIDRGLIDFKSQQAKEKRLTKEERELAGRFRVFARFLSPEDYDALVDGILKARRLQAQIELYRNYKALGLRTLDEAREHELQKKNQALTARLQRQSASYLQRPEEASAGAPLVPQNGGSVTSESTLKKRRGRPPKNPSSSTNALFGSAEHTQDSFADAASIGKSSEFPLFVLF